MNLESGPFGYGPPYNAPGPAQAAFRQHFAPNQAPAETPERLRQLALHYLHQPGAQVDTVSTGPGSPDGFTVVIIILQSPVLV